MRAWILPLQYTVSVEGSPRKGWQREPSCQIWLYFSWYPLVDPAGCLTHRSPILLPKQTQVLSLFAMQPDGLRGIDPFSHSKNPDFSKLKSGWHCPGQPSLPSPDITCDLVWPRKNGRRWLDLFLAGWQQRSTHAPFPTGGHQGRQWQPTSGEVNSVGNRIRRQETSMS